MTDHDDDDGADDKVGMMLVMTTMMMLLMMVMNDDGDDDDSDDGDDNDDDYDDGNDDDENAQFFNLVFRANAKTTDNLERLVVQKRKFFYLATYVALFGYLLCSNMRWVILTIILFSSRHLDIIVTNVIIVVIIITIIRAV